MNLPNDVARCSGKDSPEFESGCSTCQRYISRPVADEIAWMGVPREFPCPMRIPAAPRIRLRFGVWGCISGKSLADMVGGFGRSPLEAYREWEKQL